MRTSFSGFRKTSLLALGVVAVGTFGQNAQANTVTLDAVDSGKYWHSGTYSLNSGISARENYYRSFLGFDLSSIEGDIVGAILEIGSHKNNSSGQTINLWDVSTPYGNLGLNGASIYTDLGSGTLFGAGIHTSGVVNSFNLNEDALTSLNSTGGSFWAVGIQGIGTSYAFGNTWGIDSGDYLKLVLTVEVPEFNSFRESVAVPEGGSTVSLLGLAVLGCVALGRVAKPAANRVG